MAKIFLFCMASFMVLLLIFMSTPSNHRKPLFKLISASQSGIDFNNQIIPNDSLNVLSFEFLYDGGGVGIGDLNNDGLKDIVLTGNMVPSRIYLNKGNLVFVDVTQSSGFHMDRWCTGVAMGDINGDGKLDIYVCAVQPFKNKSPVSNLLFLNRGVDEKGIPRFEEISVKAGLTDSSFTSQAAFIDFDLDGDLDIYLLNNSLEDINRNLPTGFKNDGSAKSVDKLFRNEGVQDNGLPLFHDVSLSAGIIHEGWGLGVIVNDLNSDGYPDLYIANDFLSNDIAYINNADGTFTNKIREMMPHQEQNGMGVDVADINNDGLNDIFVLDMLPEDNLRQKTMFTTIGYERYLNIKKANYQDQFVRNVLQLNNGNNTYSDIGYLAEVYATDWSWGALLADFDNDGYRDIYITNGYVKDITDLDFVTFRNSQRMFGSEDVTKKNILKGIEELKGVKKPNVIFKNNGNLRFTNVTEDWGISVPSYSNGVAYADLDNDGDLDIVVNNINENVFLFENKLDGQDGKHNYLQIQCKGKDNTSFIAGLKIWIYYDNRQQYAELQTQRGYKSTVDDIIHFGLGNINLIDSIKIVWPNRLQEIMTNVNVNQRLTLLEPHAFGSATPTKEKSKTALLKKANDLLKINYRHEEDIVHDFNLGQPLIPHKFSQKGPGIAVGDINNDGLEDFVVGGSAGKPTVSFIQQPGGTFKQFQLFKKEHEDMGILLIDVDEDNDLDLYCVSGGYAFPFDHPNYQDRLYINDGSGNFKYDPKLLPSERTSGSSVSACDFDKDGDIDLFVGGRVAPQKYPSSPKSFLLQNDGTGKYDNVTNEFCPDMNYPGMITSAIWSDYNNDDWMDLIVVGEWMPITIFRNNMGVSFTKIVLPDSEGWWNSINGGDIDNDGDIDYVVGNHGLNSFFKATPKEPVTLYYDDFDRNGVVDPILCHFNNGKEYPVHPMQTFLNQMMGMRSQFSSFKKYGSSTIHDIFPNIKKDSIPQLKVVELSSIILINEGEGLFNRSPLPVEAQFSPIYGTILDNLNSDFYLDLITIGNCNSQIPLFGNMDAGYGQVLFGDGKGFFEAQPAVETGLTVKGDAKGFARMFLEDGSRVYIATQNQDSLQIFTLISDTNVHRQLLHHPKISQNCITIPMENNQRRKVEFYMGNGYMSSSSRKTFYYDEYKNLGYIDLKD